MKSNNAGCTVRILVLALPVLAVAACSSDSSQSPPAAAAQVTEGRAIYEMHCSSCHDANDLALLKQPPKLTGLFARKTLPSGAPTTDEQVRNTIVSGRGIMPPFGSTLDTKQVDELLKYLHTI